MSELHDRVPRILVVDDEDGFRDLMKTILANEGFTVDTARDGEDAVQKARNRTYDLILLDLKMPRMDGMEVLKTLRPECPTTDFIIVTGYGDVTIAVELIKLGAKEYFTKPVEPADFIQRVKSSLRAHAAELRVRDLQAEFSSRLLHDLRGPVVTLKSSIDFLLKESAGPVSSDQQQVIQDMRLSAMKLDALLNDMIDLTLFEFGKVSIEKLPVNLDVLVPAVCDRIRPRAAARNISLNVVLADGIPTLALDPEKTEQVLNNILDNAIKYTNERGSINVSVKTGNHAPAGMSDETVAISVADTGIGISKEELPLLFDKYKDLVTGKPSSLKTTGLGLAICKSIVEAHNGILTAESEPGKGTTITMYFRTGEN